MREYPRKICLEIVNLIEEKDRAYGNSYALTRQEYGELAFLIRLTDKVNRLKTLLTNPSIPHRDESIEDTIKDIIGYCLLELEYRQKLDKKPEKS